MKSDHLITNHPEKEIPQEVLSLKTKHQASSKRCRRGMTLGTSQLWGSTDVTPYQTRYGWKRQGMCTCWLVTPNFCPGCSRKVMWCPSLFSNKLIEAQKHVKQDKSLPFPSENSNQGVPCPQKCRIGKSHGQAALSLEKQRQGEQLFKTSR